MAHGHLPLHSSSLCAGCGVLTRICQRLCSQSEPECCYCTDGRHYSHSHQSFSSSMFNKHSNLSQYICIGSSGLPEIHKTVTIVNHEGEARVVCIVTAECISVVNHYYLWFMWLVSCSNCQPCSNYHVLTSNHVLSMHINIACILVYNTRSNHKNAHCMRNVLSSSITCHTGYYSSAVSAVL
jgi:hypothetical protein